VRIGNDSNWASVASGGGGNVSTPGHALAIKLDGSLWAWGMNDHGQLGLGDNTDRNELVRVGIDNNWAIVAAGGTHSLAIKTNGGLWAWGGNSSGQLGLGGSLLGTTDRNTPTRVQ